METNRTSRRTFIANSLGLLLLPLAVRAFANDDVQPLARKSHFPQMPTGFVGVTPCGSMHPPAKVSSAGRVADPAEPGQPIQISGTIYDFDGTTPAAGIVLFLYHTDARGYYNHPNSPFNPRIHGWIKTDANGNYRFATIEPGHYPELNTPAHIHVHLFASDLPEYWVDEYLFEGDPLITPKYLEETQTGRGGFNNIVKLLRGEDGVLRGIRDFKLQRVSVSGNCHLV